MKKILLIIAALIFTQCASWQGRTPAKSEVDVAPLNNPAEQFQAATVKFEKYLEEKSEQLFHPRHNPRLYSQGQYTKYVVVLIHGLYESPDYVKGLADFFYKRGANVLVPILSKHWLKDPYDIENVSYQEWVTDLEKNLEIARGLGEKIILAGHSTGGLLGVFAAVEYPADVAGLLLWSPALALSGKVDLGTRFGLAAQKLHRLDYNKIAKKPPVDPANVAYYSPLAGRQVHRLSMEMERRFRKRQPVGNADDPANPFMRPQMYQEIKVPVFIVSPGVDDVVSKSEMRSLFKNVSGAKDWLELEAEDHTSTPKREDDIVVGVQNYNKSFLPMLRKLEHFMNVNFR